MYFFYIDESGNKDIATAGTRSDGSKFEKDHLFVLTAVSLFEGRWKDFERAITNVKLEFADNLYRRTGRRFTLPECEVKSTWFRQPRQRAEQSPFLDALSGEELDRLSKTYYAQITPQHMHLFSVIVDKRKLHDHMDGDKMYKKAYEILLERLEKYLYEFHPKHNGLIIIDDVSRQENRQLAEKHSFIQREGNQVMRFHHILENPMFTDSALSNGIQLADLCAYNVFRAFKYKDFRYKFFLDTLDAVYTSRRTDDLKLDGLKVWPEDSELVEWAKESWITLNNRTALLVWRAARKMRSGWANHIELTCSTRLNKY
jgi:hypothetical protein